MLSALRCTYEMEVPAAERGGWGAHAQHIPTPTEAQILPLGECGCGPVWSVCVGGGGVTSRLVRMLPCMRRVCVCVCVCVCVKKLSILSISRGVTGCPGPFKRGTKIIWHPWRQPNSPYWLVRWSGPLKHFGPREGGWGLGVRACTWAPPVGLTLQRRDFGSRLHEPGLKSRFQWTRRTGCPPTQDTAIPIPGPTQRCSSPSGQAGPSQRPQRTRRWSRCPKRPLPLRSRWSPAMAPQDMSSARRWAAPVAPLRTVGRRLQLQRCVVDLWFCAAPFVWPAVVGPGDLFVKVAGRFVGEIVPSLV